MLRTRGHTGQWVRLLIMLVLVSMSASLIAAAPVNAAKSYPQPIVQLEVYVVAEAAGVNSGIGQALVIISDNTGMPVAKDLTNEDGHSLFDLTAGTYIVDVSAEGYYNNKAMVEINAGGPTRVLDMLMQPQAPNYRTLAVLVADGYVWGKVIVGAQVTVATPARIWAQGATDELGYFKSGLPPGTYRLTVSADGYVPTQRTIEVLADPITDIMVVLQPQQPQLLTLFAAGMLSERGIAGASVGIFNNHGALVTKGLTDDLGYYRPMLLPGLYSLIVSAPNYQTATIKVAIKDTQENNAAVVLRPLIYRTLQVLVMRGDQGMVLVNANVTVLNADNIIQAQGWTDIGGYYKPSLPVGSYTVTVNATGYEPAKVQVEVTQAPMTKLTVRMYPSTH